MSAETPTHRTIRAVWSFEAAQIIARVTRMVRDVGLAEELAQDALVAALERWPDDRRPRQPGRVADDDREAPRAQRLRPAQAARCASTSSSAHELEPAARDVAGDLDAALDDDVGDDLLRLVFIACHPVLSTEARVALTLRCSAG